MSSSPVAGSAATGPPSGPATGSGGRHATDRRRGPGRPARRIRPVSSGARPGPRRRRARYWPQYLAISPYYLIFSVFMFFPVIYTIYLAFQKWDGIGEMHYVGFQQFRFLWDDPVFWLSIRNTLVIFKIYVIKRIKKRETAGICFISIYKILGRLKKTATSKISTIRKCKAE